MGYFFYELKMHRGGGGVKERTRPFCSQKSEVGAQPKGTQEQEAEGRRGGGGQIEEWQGGTKKGEGEGGKKGRRGGEKVLEVPFFMEVGVEGGEKVEDQGSWGWGPRCLH